jgi:predicted Rossmann-fold nucleotide-binding protein
MAELHFRRECGDFFKNEARPGEVNLDEYAEAFRNEARMAELKEEMMELMLAGNPESAVELVRVLAKLKYEARRAAFPYLYAGAYGVAGFGSARSDESDPNWRECRELSARLTDKRRIRIITGGGTGHMDAFAQGVHEGRRRRAARGKKLSGAINLGMTIGLPFEEEPSPSLDVRSHHSTFGTRVPEMLDHVQAVVGGAGGMGTDFENSWAAQLAQVKHLNDGFVLLAHRSTWEQIHKAKMHAFYEARLEAGLPPMISKDKAEDDTKIVTFFDTVDEAEAILLADHRRWQAEVFDKLDAASQRKVNAWAYEKAARAKRHHEEAAK